MIGLNKGRDLPVQKNPRVCEGRHIENNIRHIYYTPQIFHLNQQMYMSKILNVTSIALG